jgi:hypothetical protein
MVRSYIELKVMVATEVVMCPDDEDDELYSFPKPVDAVSDEFFISALYFWPLLSLAFGCMRSESRPGFVISLSFTCTSPSSILTTMDMVGRSFGMSWVQRRPIFRNLQASSMKSSSNDASTNLSNSPLSNITHVCKIGVSL